MAEGQRYNPTMHENTQREQAARSHLDNVAGNLQLAADLAYGDVALAVAREDGSLLVEADARPMTAHAAMAATRAGRVLSRRDEPEAYAAYTSDLTVRGERRRSTRGIAYQTSAHPVTENGRTVAVIIVDVTLQALEAPGKMERSFMDLADGLMRRLGTGSLRDLLSGSAFSTTRRAGDGVMAVAPMGNIDYASPNAVNIMKGAGFSAELSGTAVRDLPGALSAVVPVLGTRDALALEVDVADRVLSYRTIAVDGEILVLVEDVTDVRRREREIKVKDATIREVHHRVKNNLQTIASLLRIQARRTGSSEAARSLREAVERISSMAVVHEQLTGSDDERVDFADSAHVIVDMVLSGLAGGDAKIDVTVEGTTGEVPAQVATSLALVTAELVHNAIEHGIGPTGAGRVEVSLRRLAEEIKLAVHDTGGGLPADFDVDTSANLGLAIVKTVVEEDLKGTLAFSRGRGTTVTIRVPLAAAGHAPPLGEGGTETAIEPGTETGLTEAD